jgi:hypothetical protein
MTTQKVLWQWALTSLFIGENYKTFTAVINQVA